VKLDAKVGLAMFERLWTKVESSVCSSAPADPSACCLTAASEKRRSGEPNEVDGIRVED
jgi:hypothetical protein